MYSTLLWYIDDSKENSEISKDTITVEYVKQDGKLYAGRSTHCDTRRYFDGKFVPGRNTETTER